MTIKYSLYAALGAVVLLGGCRPSDQGPQTDYAFSTVSEAAAYTLEGSAQEYGLEHDLDVACRLDLLMPVKLGGSEVFDLQETIRSAAYDARDGSSVQDFFKASTLEFGFAVMPLMLNDSTQASLQRSNADLQNFDGFVLVEGSVALLTPAVMSYRIDRSDYPPRAAHGMYGVSYINYDIRGERTFTLTDLFKPEALASLPAIIRAKARSMAAEIGRTDIQALPAGGDFTITADGDVVFVYQPYEVASYAQGIIRIPLAAYTLESSLTPYGQAMLLEAP